MRREKQDVMRLCLAGVRSIGGERRSDGTSERERLATLEGIDGENEDRYYLNGLFASSFGLLFFF